MENVINKDFYLIDGKWHHCVWTNGKQYIDGVLANTSRKYIKGEVYDRKDYDRALSQSEVTALYKKG